MIIHRNESIIAKKWSGGLTSELFIYPEGGNYTKREFSFRLSKATIEIAESEFTALPNVKRELMVLSGELQLVHQNKYNKRLLPFESDRFSGSWKTKSCGLAEDFNLMMLGHTEGYLEHISATNSTVNTIETDCDIAAIYCAEGQLKMNDMILKTGDIAIITDTKKEERLQLMHPTDLIIVRIWINQVIK